MSNASRVPPHDLEAEKSVLGAVLIDKDALVDIVEIISPGHFYKNAHAKIFHAMIELYERREPTDLITLPNELKKMNELDKVGGVSYLTELVNAVPTASNVEAYARIIKDYAIKRHLLIASGNITDLVFSESNTDELVDKAEHLVYSVAQGKDTQDYVSIRDSLEITFERLDELSKTRGSLRGVPTGLKTVDKILFGLQKEALYILAARPSVGKTSLALNIAQFAAVNHKKGVLIFSLEMGHESLTDRMAAAQAGIDNFKISTGNLEPEDFERYGIAAGELAEADIFIIDTAGLTSLEVRTKARRVMQEYDIDLIVVDYLQLMRGRSTHGRTEEVTEISQSLKNLARELKVPVLALSQLNRSVETRGGDKKPQLSDLRDSGSIEQDADVVMFLYRPDEEDRTQYKLFIAKHRNGATGEIDLFFKSSQTKFYEVDRQHT